MYEKKTVKLEPLGTYTKLILPGGFLSLRDSKTKYFWMFSRISTFYLPCLRAVCAEFPPLTRLINRASVTFWFLRKSSNYLFTSKFLSGAFLFARMFFISLTLRSAFDMTLFCSIVEKLVSIILGLFWLVPAVLTPNLYVSNASKVLWNLRAVFMRIESLFPRGGDSMLFLAEIDVLFHYFESCNNTLFYV